MPTANTIFLRLLIMSENTQDLSTRVMTYEQIQSNKIERDRELRERAEYERTPEGDFELVLGVKPSLYQE